MKQVLSALALSTALLGAAPAFATTHGNAAQSASTTLTQGEIRKVDKDAKKLTIRHQAITNLDMPPMTMVFQVQDTAVLDQVKVGDKVRFAADKKDGAFIVTAVEADR
ncbi:MAG TPA: copper-binding protein [Burkholderiales bacterium]|nr:copper-binding protein [Burkholderiales bacterium]